MSASKSFYFTTQLEISPYPVIGKYSETINNSGWFAYLAYDIIRIKIQIVFMRYCKYHGINIFKNLFQVMLHTDLL